MKDPNKFLAEVFLVLKIQKLLEEHQT